jgi:16S rRNA (cytosine967-C5)-methyltransferase
MPALDLSRRCHFFKFLSHISSKRSRPPFKLTLSPSELTLFKIVSGEKPRQIALELLRHRRTGEGFIERALEKEFAAAGLSPLNRSLCMELVYGVVRWQATLDWLVARRTPGRPPKPALQTLLALGLYQIFWLDRIPEHAAVHETVELAKQNGFGAQAGFVNAVLRGYLRELDATKKLLADLKTAQPHLGYSHPEWLVARWRKRWNADQVARLLEWNNTPSENYARVNTLKVDAGRLLTQWREENVEYDFIHRDWFEENLVFKLKSHPPLLKLHSFQRGWFYVQDPGTLFAVRELDPRPGETVLDLCAAPGGKTTYIAQLMQNQGRVVAHDTAPARLKLVGENCSRLGVVCVQTTLPAALKEHSAAYDRILVDAPCSNTGVMRRRVDLRWRIRPEEIQRCQTTQLALLNQAAAILKSGGTLVYSTCSLEPEENREVVGQFLAGQSRFKLLSERELIPFIDGVDGAYVARLTTS